jgi:coiled-coil domain-containing protein 55
LEQQHAAALKEDPNVFDYDGVYDQMKQAQAKPAQQQQAQRQVGLSPDCSLSHI